MEIKKVIVLTIDSLKHNRLSSAGYPLKLTPTIDFMAKNGIYCTQAIAHASSTQMSHPSIWTSSLPLDFGGYDWGIKGRPVALAEIFRQNGFKTIAFSTSFYFDYYYKYDRGFDELHSLYGVRGMWYIIYQYNLRHYLSIWHEGIINNEQLLQKVFPILEHTFKCIISFCEDKKKLVFDDNCIHNPIVYQYDFEKISHKCTRILMDLQENSESYIFNNLDKIATPELNILLDLDLPSLNFYERTLVKVLLKTPFFPLHLMGINLKNLKGVSPSTLVNGSYVLQLLNSRLEEKQSGEEFLWVCLDDVHEMYCSPSTIQNPFRFPKLFFERAKLGDQYPGGFSYDLSLKYLDTLIAKLIKKLKISGQLEQTLIVICSDHGRHWFLDGALAQRERKNVLDFYEEDLRVPLIFWNPHLEPQKIEHLCGLIDLAPTLIDLMGFSSVPSFQGLPVYSAEAKARTYLIAEDAGQGPCDFANKALRITVRTPDYKYIWQEANENEERNELYDLKKDPQEKHNLVDEWGYEAISQELKAIILQRWQTVKGVKGNDNRSTRVGQRQ